MTQYPVSPEDQPMQSRDIFVPEHSSAAPDTTPDPDTKTAPSAAQTEAPKGTEASETTATSETGSSANLEGTTSTPPHVSASRMMGQIVPDGGTES